MKSLLDEVKFMGKEQKHEFDWDLSLFQDKQCVSNVTEENIQEDRAPLLEAVANELRVQDQGGPLNYDPQAMAPGHFVIVKASSADPLKRPFWLCQIVKNSPGG
jgi:hypothetical protein